MLQILTNNLGLASKESLDQNVFETMVNLTLMQEPLLGELSALLFEDLCLPLGEHCLGAMVL